MRLFRTRERAKTEVVEGTSRVRLYFSPHQDDELLTMGISIRNALHTNGLDSVHVVLCSDGLRSSARERLCDGAKCPLHEQEHIYSLSTEEFIDARDREFLGSCLALGVRPQNIHFGSKRMVDGSVDVEGAESIIQRWSSKYPGATVCTVSPEVGATQHRDHRAVGAAAVSLLQRGGDNHKG